MNHIFRGEIITDQELIEKLKGLNSILAKDILLEPLSTDIVISAIDQLATNINREVFSEALADESMPVWKIDHYVDTIRNSFNKNELEKKVLRELGCEPFQWKQIEAGVYEKKQPYGVLLHFGAGNVIALSAISVIEGLLSGNINILKVPSCEKGISVMFLQELIEIEPRLKPYIYVLDISSKQQETLKELAELADAVIVWGSDEAVLGIRRMAPPTLPIIEWGHRISFAYFKSHEDIDRDLEMIAKEICLTEQQNCSSPQCIFFETNSNACLEEFAEKLAKYIEISTKKYKHSQLSDDSSAFITYSKELVRMEEILGNQKIIENGAKDFAVMIDYKAGIKTSPLYRNIWVMPIILTELMDVLRPYKNYLQTVGISCDVHDEKQLCKILYAAGVSRITSCGNMSNTYSGEPHDGLHTLARYVRIVSKQI